MILEVRSREREIIHDGKQGSTEVLSMSAEHVRKSELCRLGRSHTSRSWTLCAFLT
jgi:hypothetical protein